MFVSLVPVLRNIDLIPVAHQKVYAAVRRSSGVRKPVIDSGATPANLKSEDPKSCKSNRILSKGRRNYIPGVATRIRSNYDDIEGCKTVDDIDR